MHINKSICKLSFIIILIAIFLLSCKKRVWDNLNDANNDFDIIIEMVDVKGGSFYMGSSNGDADELPEHSVSVNDFFISKYEVTQKLYYLVMDSLPSYKAGCDNCPVERVSWNDVKTFLNRLYQITGLYYRLPTEAEWEYAARGGNLRAGYEYSGSNNPGDVGWYYDNSNNETQQVGSKNANELGIFDMSGNVYEWCNDWYDPDYYDNSPSSNPTGPANGADKVIRGGGYTSTSYHLRSSFRFYSDPNDKWIDVGFRLVKNK
ncbi:formylglycine-generating enzyme family protein [Bacteroidota bacterium]